MYPVRLYILMGSRWPLHQTISDSLAAHSSPTTSSASCMHMPTSPPQVTTPPAGHALVRPSLDVDSMRVSPFASQKCSEADGVEP